MIELPSRGGSSVHRWLWAPVLALSVFCGCATISPIAPIDTSTVTYLDDGFSESELQDQTLVVLPVVAGEGYEGFRRLAADQLWKKLKANKVADRVVTDREALSALNEAGLADAYAEMIRSYEKTAILGRTTLQEIAEATNARFFLFRNSRRRLKQPTRRTS